MEVQVVDERGVAAAGLDVLSHSADGTLSDRSVTGADGTAVVHVPTGGLVSILFDRHNPLLEGAERSVQSVAPPPGRQSLRFITYESQPDDGGPSMGPVVIDYGDLAPDESFFITASCSRDLELDFPAENQVALQNYRGCPGTDVFDVFASRVLFDGSDIIVTHTAAVMGVPFTLGEGVELAFEWEPAVSAETIWQVDGVLGTATAFPSGWWIVGSPYALVPDVATQQVVNPLESASITVQSATQPGELQCVSLGIERDAASCTSSQRTVCGDTAPAQIDWPLDRLAVPTLDSDRTGWSTTEGELGDYFEVRQYAPTLDGANVGWSLQVGIDVSSRPTALELPDDLSEHYDPVDPTSAGVFVNNVDVDGVSGFDAVLDAQGATPLLPGARPISRESVYRRPCAD